MAAGSCSWNTPNIDSASSTISPAMASTTQACCSHTVSSAPVNPASTPTAV